MGQKTNLVEKLKNALPITRRSFVKSAMLAGVAASAYGCSKDDSGSEIIYGGGTVGADPADLTADRIVYGTGTHNCGSRCLTKAHVKNGRIIRITTDDTEYVDGRWLDPENYNNTQSRACSKCRSYKYRLYHPGRLKYPLKQTKKRGDLSGFVRISWEQALNEIARKHKAIITKYGPEAISHMYATANQNLLQRLWRYSANSVAGQLLGGNSLSLFSYSTHQWGFLGYNHTGYGQFNGSANAADIAGVVKNAVLWGSNGFTTRNHLANVNVRAFEKMRDNGGKVTFIAPEFVDQGVCIADEWVQTKPFTDAAVMNAMIYEMLINTFDEDGTIKDNAWLDVDYIDTCIHGFFDSPEYWIDSRPYTDGTDTSAGTTENPDHNKISLDMSLYPAKMNEWTKETKNFWINNTTREVRATNPNNTKDWVQVSARWQNNATPTIYSYIQPYAKVNAVPDGKSLSAYIMGDKPHLKNAKYKAGTTYIAQTFKNEGAGEERTRNKAVCSYTATKGAATQYETKKSFSIAKTPEWASQISGIPAEKIRKLAEIYAKPENHPVYTEWSGGQQKQADGVITLFAMQALLLVSKTYGQTGDSMNWVDSVNPIADGGFIIEDLPAPTTIRTANGGGVNNYTITDPVPANPKTPSPSCIAWFNGIRLAFGDVMKKNGYTGKYIPDQKEIGTGKVYHDDGGAKAFVKIARNLDGSPKTYTDKDGNTYYDWVGRTGISGTANAHEGTPIYSGYRFMINEGGNILMNQHENPNDTREMLESIPVITNPDDPDDFCFVALDNFLSPTPRWADYVLPGATNWEQEQADRVSTGAYLFIPVASNPPGEAKSCRDFTIAYLREYEKIDGSKAGIAQKYIGADSVGGKIYDNDTYAAKHERAYEKSNVKTDVNSRFYGKTFEEAIAMQYLPKKPSTAPVTAVVSKTAFRLAVEAYLTNPARGTTPFIPTNAINTEGNTYKNGNEYPEHIAAQEPNQSGRATVYAERMVFQYEHRFEKWHGYLVPSGKQGQTNKDPEGDPIVYPIPMYYAYQDYHMEAYGGKDKLPADPFLLTTTHDHHRVHSTHAENPLLRELTHRTRGGKLYSGNDWKSYALSEAENGVIPRLNKAIQMKTADATWSEIWMNADDAAKRGIKDGDLLKVENPIGAVRVIARLTRRCAPGFVSLHQGCWYDPDPVDGVDDGGNCNTLMAAKPSRVDHGNGQQSAMVSISKVL